MQPGDDGGDGQIRSRDLGGDYDASGQTTTRGLNGDADAPRRRLGAVRGAASGYPSGISSSSDIGYQISVPQLLAKTGSDTIESVPSSFYEGLKAQGFAWILLTEFPDDANLDVVAAQVAAAGLVLKTSFDQLAQFAVDPTGADLLRSGDWDAFVRYVEGLDDDQRLLHVSSGDPWAVALLLLPGLRVFRDEDAGLMERLLPVFARDALAKGTFSIPNVQRIFGNLAAWKYTYGNERVLVCVNFVNAHAVANVHCPEAPDAETEKKTIDVLELLSDTLFRRNPEEMRGNGLHVILHEFELQVFTY